MYYILYIYYILQQRCQDESIAFFACFLFQRNTILLTHKRQESVQLTW